MKESHGACRRSRVAYDTDISKIAFIVSIKDDRNSIIHISSFGVLHRMNLAENEISLSCYQNLTFHISKYLRSDIYHDKDDLNTASVSVDDELRNHQAETFMTLVYDIQESSVLSLELASPALHALQMLLQSDWQPGCNFSSQFLEALVQILYQFEDQKRTIENSTNGSISSSCSNIAEDLIKTIFYKYPKNNDIILDILFNKLRGVKLYSEDSILVSVLSEGLEWYMRSSLSSIVAHIVQRTNIFAQNELIGANKAKADTKWRSSLNLGDSVEVKLDSSNLECWVKTCIVRINLQTDTFTLEYLERPLLSMQQVDDTEMSSQLLQLSRTSPSIRPIGSVEIREVSNYELMNSSEVFTVTGEEKIDNLDPSLIPNRTEVKALRYTVGKHHKEILELLFNSMKPITSQQPESTSDFESKQKTGISDPPPKCTRGHEMVMKFSWSITNPVCGECNLICIVHSKSLHCDQCLSWNNNCRGCNDEDEDNLWYCGPCNYHVCVSCHPVAPTLSTSKSPDHNQSFPSISGTSHLKNENVHESHEISTLFPVNTNPMANDNEKIVSDRNICEDLDQLNKMNYEIVDLIEATVRLDKARKGTFISMFHPSYYCFLYSLFITIVIVGVFFSCYYYVLLPILVIIMIIVILLKVLKKVLKISKIFLRSPKNLPMDLKNIPMNFLKSKRFLTVHYQLSIR